MPTSSAQGGRTRTDLCPGALRPWPAGDGLLVRLRLVGGRLPVASLTRLLAVSGEFGDGRLHLTRRANLQLRGLPGRDGQLDPAVLSALESTGLLPSRTHELVRNILVSPQSGYGGGRADLRPVAQRLDALLCGDPRFAGLPGRFLFTLDDGHGDLLDRLTAPRGTDLGLVALSETEAQLRIGQQWGKVVRVQDSPGHLAALAEAFLAARGNGVDAPWHIRELTAPLVPVGTADPRLPAPRGPLRYGAVPGGIHREIPGGVLTADLGHAVAETRGISDLVVTPWHGILIPRTQETIA